MNHQDLMELTRDIGAERAAMEHVERSVERSTDLPTSLLRKEVDLLKIEEQCAANLDDALRLIRGASRAAVLLAIDPSSLLDLNEAEIRLLDVQSELARRRGSE